MNFKKILQLDKGGNMEDTKQVECFKQVSVLEQNGCISS